MNTPKLVRSFLTLATLALAAAVPVCAQEVAPMPVPTMITSAPFTITAPGYYQLGADLVYAGNGSANDAIITVNANAVILDFGGHRITGTTNVGTQLYGVYANEHGNITIKNGTIGRCFIGVCLQGNGQTGSLNFNHNIHDLLITNCYFAGALFAASTNSQISTCRISNIGGTTITKVSIGGSQFDCAGNTLGIAFTIGSGNVGSGNTVTNNAITDLTASNANYGIYDGFNEVVASGNTISTLSATGYGMYAVALAVNNTITGSTNGISGTTKCANNLTSGCTNAFPGSGTGNGYNN